MYFTVTKTADDKDIKFTQVKSGENQNTSAIYFTNLEGVSKYIHQGDYIKEIILPIRDKELKIIRYEDTYYVNKLIVNKTYNIVDFILTFKDKLNKEFWREISFTKVLKAPLLKELKDVLDWDYISAHQVLDDASLHEFADMVNWKLVSWYQNLSPEMIRETAELLDWGYVSSCQKMDESILEEFNDKVNWSIICQVQKLSENCMRNNADKIDWNSVSKYQALPEKFIEECTELVNWELISEFQKLSKDFILANKQKVVKAKILSNKNIRLSDSMSLKNLL